MNAGVQRTSADAPASGPRRLAAGVWLREATLGDFEAISAVKQRCGLSADSQASFASLWAANPIFTAGTCNERIGWVIEAHERIVGFIGSIPHLYRAGARRLTGAISTSFVVDASHRAHSLALAAAFFKQPGVDLLVSTTANPAAAKVYQAFGGRTPDAATHGTALFWTLRPSRVAAAAWRKRGLPGGLSSAAGAVLGTIGSMVNAFGGRKPSPGAQQHDIRHYGAGEVDASFDALFERRLRGTEELLASRESAWLRWHFAPRGNRESWLLAAHRNGEPAGYVALTTDKHERLGMRRARVADLFADPSMPGLVDDLLHAAWSDARRRGCDLVELVGFGPAIRTVAERGRPFSRLLPSQPFVYRIREAGVASSVAAAGGWQDISPYDGDATL